MYTLGKLLDQRGEISCDGWNPHGLVHHHFATNVMDERGVEILARAKEVVVGVLLHVENIDVIVDANV